jgi:ribonuclease Z
MSRARPFVAALLLLFAQPLGAFDGIRLTLLGSIGSSGQSASGPATIVEAGDEVVLVDCGAGTLERLRAARFLADEVTAVLLTSLDAGHVAGCGEVLAARLRAGSAYPLPVWGPNGTMEAVQAWVGAHDGVGPEGIDPREIGENVVYDTGEVKVTAIVAEHSAQAAAYGYRVERERRAVVLLGGARYSPNVAINSRRAQVVGSDVAGALSEQPAADDAERDALAGHAAPEDAGRILNEARAYLGLYTHLRLFGIDEEEIVRRTRRYYRGPLQIGRAGMIVEIQNEVQVRSTPSDGPRQ